VGVARSQAVEVHTLKVAARIQEVVLHSQAEVAHNLEVVAHSEVVVHHMVAGHCVVHWVQLDLEDQKVTHTVAGEVHNQAHAHLHKAQDQ